MNEPEKMSECLLGPDLLKEAAPPATSEQLSADTSDSSSRVYFISSDYSLPSSSLTLPSVLLFIPCAIALASDVSLQDSQIFCLHAQTCGCKHASS